MKHLKKVSIDLSKSLCNPIQVKQSDNARYLLFRILDNGVPFDLTGKTVRVFGKKPDSKEIYNDMALTNATKGECELRLTSGALSTPGILQLEIEIKENEDTISTFILDVEVVESLRSNSGVESSDEYGVLGGLIKKADEWDKVFTETSGKIEEKYTERLNGIEVSVENITPASIGALPVTGKAESSKVADSVEWNNISSKPNNFTPSSHTHDWTQVTVPDRGSLGKGFMGRFSENGFTNLPNGIVIQWGVYDINLSNEVNKEVTVNFPTAFPSQAYCIVVSEKNNNRSPSGRYGVAGAIIGRNSFTLAVCDAWNTSHTGVVRTHWIAIGR